MELLTWFIIQAIKRGLSCQCFLFEGKVETDNIYSRFHIVSDLRLLFRFNVIYCSACAPKLPLNTHGWGPDSCSPIQCRCFNTWISEFRVWAMVSFWLNWGKYISHWIRCSGKHTRRSAGAHSIKEGGWNEIKPQHLRLLIAHISGRLYFNFFLFNSLL